MFGLAFSPLLALCCTRTPAVESGVIYLRATLKVHEVFLRAFLAFEPTMAQVMVRTEQRYLEGLFCLLPPPNLFTFDLSIRTDRYFLQQDPRGCW